jgi:hypothetical protein
VQRRLPAIGAFVLILATALGSSHAGGAVSRTGAASAARPLAVPALPTPGTAREIASLVKAAPQIRALPATTSPALADAAANRPGAYYPTTVHGCLLASSCVFGDTAAKRTIVLFGDSHAVMWLPALDPIGKALGYRVVLLYASACPAVTVTIYLAPGQYGAMVGYYKWCNLARNVEIKSIRQLKPLLVLLASKTFLDYSSPTTFFTEAQWKQGLARTVARVRTSATRVAVIGDITYMPLPLPQCLAAYPSDIQKCGGSSPNTVSHENQAAERAEAKALKVPYIETNRWVCTSWCSPVVGNMIVNLDQSHINAVYAEFLTNVLQASLKPLLAG